MGWPAAEREQARRRAGWPARAEPRRRRRRGRRRRPPERANTWIGAFKFPSRLNTSGMYGLDDDSNSQAARRQARSGRGRAADRRPRWRWPPSGAGGCDAGRHRRAGRDDQGRDLFQLHGRADLIVAARRSKPIALTSMSRMVHAADDAGGAGRDGDRKRATRRSFLGEYWPTRSPTRNSASRSRPTTTKAVRRAGRGGGQGVRRLAWVSRPKICP